MFAGHLDLTQPLVWTVDDALPRDAWPAYVARMRAGDAEVAPVITARGTEVELATRSNTRVMWDDAAHWDTVVELGDVVSLLTLVFYLDDGCEGGETEFPKLRRTIAPRAGRALLFQHRVLHEATAVRRGEKHVLRTDVLYR